MTIIDGLFSNSGSNYFNIKPIKKKVYIKEENINSDSLIPFIKKSSLVFNLAGLLSHVDALKDPLIDLHANTVDQLMFLENCRKHNSNIKIVLTGTRNQYGRTEGIPVTEDHTMIPIDTNGISEIAKEHYHRLYYELYGLKSTTIRLCNVFGPRHQMGHSRQGVLNWFLRQLIDDKKIQLMGGGAQIRESIYVDDLVNALFELGKRTDVWGEAFNIGAYTISLKEFVETAIRVYGKGSYTIVDFPIDRKAIEPGDYRADYSKLMQYTNWKPNIDLSEALSRTFEYYTQNKKYYW